MANDMRSPDRDRWLALALLVGVLALAYLVLVHPWWTVPMQEASERIDTLQQRELRQRMQLEQAPEVQRRLAQVRARQSDLPGFLPEATAELATAGLVQRLESVVAQASPGNRSCAISNRSPLTEPRRDRYARVVVQVPCVSPTLLCASSKRSERTTTRSPCDTAPGVTGKRVSCCASAR